MRILIATDTYAPSVDGVSTFSQCLARELAADGCKVVVVCPDAVRPQDQSSMLNLLQVRSIRVGLLDRRWLPIQPNLRAWLRDRVEHERPDVIHVQTPLRIGMAACDVARQLGVPLVASFHIMPENLGGIFKVGSQLAPMFRRLHWACMRRFLSNANVVVAPSSAARDILKANVPEQRDIRVISCGVDTALHRPGDDGGRRSADGTCTLLYVGRLGYDKSIDTLIRAASVSGDERLRVRIVGDGPARGSLEALADGLGIRRQVSFPGCVSDSMLRRFYRSSHVFCMPSCVELQSIATLEAMATGLPVIAADALALPLLVRDRVTGLVFQPRDPVDLAAKIRVVIEHPGDAQRMGQAGRELALSHDLAITRSEFANLYGELVSMARHG